MIPDNGAMYASLQKAVCLNSRVAARRPLAQIMTQPRQYPPDGGKRHKVVTGPPKRMYGRVRTRILQGLQAQVAAGHPGEEDGGNAGRPSGLVLVVSSSGGLLATEYGPASDA